MKKITLMVLILTLSSCSIDTKKEEVAVIQDDLEFAVDTLAETQTNAEFKVEEQQIATIVDPDEKKVLPVEDLPMVAPTEPKFEEFTNTPDKVDPPQADSPVEITIVKNTERSQTYGQMETYKVQKGDTMMMVAFKIYGDYRKWKDLSMWNKDVKKIREGVELKYEVPEKAFGWVPSGLPYLIKMGDTLQIVSADKYGTIRKWKDIYNNNRPLIKDPNLIFAGFTIYYQPTRELASEKK